MALRQKQGKTQVGLGHRPGTENYGSIPDGQPLLIVVVVASALATGIVALIRSPSIFSHSIPLYALHC